MPIRLLDTTTEQSWTPQEGVTIRYRQAKSGDALRAISKSRDAVTGAVDGVRADAAVVAAHVVGWDGIEDAAGAPVAWPAELDAQLALLDELPWWIYAALRTRITEAVTEAISSGKDSARS